MFGFKILYIVRMATMVKGRLYFFDIIIRLLKNSMVNNLPENINAAKSPVYT